MAVIDPDWTAIALSSPVTWSTDLSGSVNWTASGGTPTSSSGAGFPWTSPSVAGPVRVTATNGAIILIRDLIATDYNFPYKPSIAVDGTEDDTAIIHRLESGIRNGRRVIGTKKAFELKFNSRGNGFFPDRRQARSLYDGRPYYRDDSGLEVRQRGDEKLRPAR